MARKVEARYDCAGGGSQACIEEFLDDYYDLIDPEGVAERLEENARIEK